MRGRRKKNGKQLIKCCLFEKKLSEYYIKTHDLTGICKLATEKFLFREEKIEKKKKEYFNGTLQLLKKSKDDWGELLLN